MVNKMQVITAAHCCEGQLAALDSVRRKIRIKENVIKINLDCGWST